MESHHHEHNHQLTSLNKAFIIGITLNIAFVIVEFGVGFYYNSLGLLSDAGHNLGDVASLVLAMLAFRLQKVHPNSRYTYGYKKSTILVSLLNAVILLVAVGIIIAESVDKLFHPVSVDGSAIAWTAGVGVVINALTAWLFMKDKDKDLNVKGAYLHMAADALVSVGVVASGIIITYTGWSIIDPIIGLGMMQRAVAARRHRPILIIDLAVPRDVEEEVSRLDDVYIYTIDDLGKVVASGKESRRMAVTKAEDIIESRVQAFEGWLAARDAVPAIQALRSRAEAMREAEVKKAQRHLAAGHDAASVIEELSRALTNKLIHDPTTLLRNGTGLSAEERARENDILNEFYRSSRDGGVA